MKDAENVSFQQMLESVPNLPFDIKADILSNSQFHFVLQEVMTDVHAMRYFTSQAQAEMTDESFDTVGIEPSKNHRVVGIKPDQMSKLIVFLYRNIYLRMRDDMNEVERKVFAEAAMYNMPNGRA